MRTIRSFVGICCLALPVLGCTTPESVTSAQETTAGNTLSLSLSLDKYVRDSAAQAQRRAARIGGLAGVVDRVVSRTTEQKDTARAAGAPNILFTRMNEIKRLSDERNARLDKSSEAAAKATGGVLDSLETLSVKSDQLRVISSQMDALSKDRSWSQDLSFASEFIGSVAKDVNKAIKDAKEQQEKAKEPKAPTDAGARPDGK